MGQSHSTPPGSRGSSEEGSRKKDYYELLGVDQNASPEEIKKAYRKKALELHPDRNYGNVEAATQLFAEIQSAYEVLSDPQERSWYDSHRDAFLGGDGSVETTDYSYNARMTTSADILKLFSKFSPQMEFSDSPNGFYGGLRETFAQLALEEEMACRWENIDIFEYPSFGSRDDDFEAVRQFYAVWASFSTRKSFSWKDAYRYSEAPDRRVRRMMEKENKRLREGAIREFNEAVRSLVAFVRKRDPRYKSYKDSQSQHRELLRQSSAAQATRSRAANQAKLRGHIVQDWAKSEELAEDETETSEVETEHFECIVCRKTFKSQNQVQAHERSKKHIKAVKQLQWEMRLQHEELQLDKDVNDNMGKSQRDDFHSNNPITAPHIPSEQIEAHADETRHNKIEKSPNPKISSIATEYLADGESNMASSAQNEPSADVTRCRDDESDYTTREALENRLALGEHSAQEEAEEDSVDEMSHRLSTSGLNESCSSPPKKTGKAKQRRAKKAQFTAEKSQSKCTICNASFPSRNKLFSHLKLNHARRECD